MKTKPPPDRRKFASVRDQMDYLYHKLLYWLYEREEPSRSRAFATRLAKVLTPSAPDEGSIFPEECRSLICEANEDLRGAIKLRENEIRLIKRLHEISQRSPQREYVLGIYGYDDLSDRLDLLAGLYHDDGNPDKAIAILCESKKLCQKHGIAFDGQDMLQEYLDENGESRQH